MSSNMLAEQLTQSRIDAENFRFLIGKEIISIRYLTQYEALEMGWSKRPLVIIFKDGTKLIPQCDDEGNDGGALWFLDNSNNRETIIYTN